MSTFSSSQPPRKKSVHDPPRSCEVCGQCSVCLDLFSVHVYLFRDTLRIADAARLKWRGKTLQHLHPFSPTLPVGKVSLYGSLDSLEWALPSTNASHYIVPGSNQTTKARLTLSPQRV